MKDGVFAAPVGVLPVAAAATDPDSISSRNKSSSDFVSFRKASSLAFAAFLASLPVSPELDMSKGTPEGPKIDSNSLAGWGVPFISLSANESIGENKQSLIVFIFKFRK